MEIEWEMLSLKNTRNSSSTWHVLSEELLAQLSAIPQAFPHYFYARCPQPSKSSDNKSMLFLSLPNSLRQKKTPFFVTWKLGGPTFKSFAIVPWRTSKPAIDENFWKVPPLSMNWKTLTINAWKYAKLSPAIPLLYALTVSGGGSQFLVVYKLAASNNIPSRKKFPLEHREET